MYKSKYPSLIDFLTNQEEMILLDSEIQNIENLIDKDLKDITVTYCCETLKDKEETAFELWLKNFKKTEYGYWFNKRTVYCYEAMKDIYKTSVKPNL